MKQSNRILLILAIFALLPIIVKLQTIIDPKRSDFQPGRGVSSMVTQIGNSPVVLPSQFVAGTVIGFREVVAGLLWVRADSFFHSGNYEAIVPLTRIITWLDPHQIEVYRTGSWHLSFNFVDSSRRADRRYLAPAITFLKEGIANNSGLCDIKFDLGFLHYNMKAQDFEQSAYWIHRASLQKDSRMPIDRQVAHAYVKAGRIDDAIAQLEKCVNDAEEALEKNPEDFVARDHLLVSKRLLDVMKIRKVMRADLHKNPVDIGFEAEFKRLGPRVFQIRGKANIPYGGRIDLILHDEDYKEVESEEFSWEVDSDTTILTDMGIHGLFVENGEFVRTYDLTKDIRQYTFTKEKYILTLTFDPRATPDYIQDSIGWHGNGMTDKNYLDTSEPGVQRIKKVIHLTREDII